MCCHFFHHNLRKIHFNYEDMSTCSFLLSVFLQNVRLEDAHTICLCARCVYRGYLSHVEKVSNRLEKKDTIRLAAEDTIRATIILSRRISSPLSTGTRWTSNNVC